MSTQPVPNIWQENLEALRAVDPPLADQLANLTIPPTVQPATSRDGYPTYRIQNPDGTTTRFGRTSMPTVSADGILRQFNAGSGNVVLSGIGAGLEARLLSERRGRHRAAFILETTPLNILLALTLWDMAAPIRNRQIIILLAADLPQLHEKLVHICLSFPGLELPTRMLAWPWRAKADNQPWQDLLEEAARQITQARNKCLVEQMNRLGKRGKPSAQLDSIAVLTTVPGILVTQAVEALAGGARAEGYETVSSWPDSPLHSGHLPGLIAAAETAGKAKNTQILLVDQCRNHWPVRDLQAHLITWLVTADQLNETYAPVSGKDDWVVTTTDKQREQLQPLGWKPDRILASGPFIGPNEFADPPESSRQGIVLLHDLTPEDPEQAGVTLYSHKVLWQALRDRINREPDAWQPAEVERWLQGAQATTGIDLADPAVQDQFMGVVQRHLAPSIVLSRAAHAIVQAGLPLEIRGRGWDKISWAKDLHKGPVDDPQKRLAVLRQARVALLGDGKLGQAWIALEAAAAGTAIIARRLWPASDPTTLFLPGKEMVAWTTQQELIERLRYLLKNDPARTDMTQRARQRAMTDYSASARLRQVITAVVAGT